MTNSTTQENGHVATHDVTIRNEGNIWMITFNNDAVQAWAEDNFFWEAWQWFGKRTLCVSQHFVKDVVQMLADAGFTIRED